MKSRADMNDLELLKMMKIIVESWCVAKSFKMLLRFKKIIWVQNLPLLPAFERCSGQPDDGTDSHHRTAQCRIQLLVEGKLLGISTQLKHRKGKVDCMRPSEISQYISEGKGFGTLDIPRKVSVCLRKIS